MFDESGDAVESEFAPEKGDIIWLDFDPVLGHEQSGRRPALVFSSYFYNKTTGRCVVCPITTKIKGYPFEVRLPVSCQISGVCLVDHIKNQDWTVRNIRKITSLKNEDLAVMQGVLSRLLFG